MSACPVCGIEMEVVQTKSRAGTKQFAQRCLTHGRRTVQRTTAALAAAETVLTTKPAKGKEPT